MKEFELDENERAVLAGEVPPSPSPSPLPSPSSPVLSMAFEEEN